jgi:hypothetical protein
MRPLNRIRSTAASPISAPPMAAEMGVKLIMMFASKVERYRSDLAVAASRFRIRRYCADANRACSANQHARMMKCLRYRRIAK